MPCSCQFWHKNWRRNKSVYPCCTCAGGFSRLLTYIWSWDCCVTSGQALNRHNCTPILGGFLCNDFNRKVAKLLNCSLVCPQTCMNGLSIQFQTNHSKSHPDFWGCEIPNQTGLSLTCSNFFSFRPPCLWTFPPSQFDDHSQVNLCMSALPFLWPSNRLPSENPIPLKARPSSGRSRW